MKNIDDFMRQKFDNDPDKSGRFDFREEYWEQAQAMLEAEEARRKRRRWLLWWAFSVAVAVVAVAVYSSSGSGQKQVADGGSSDSRQEQRAEKSGSGSGQEQILSGHSAGSEAVQTQGSAAAKGFILEEKTLVADSVFLKNKIENQGFGTKNGAAGNRFAPEQPSGKGGDLPAKKPQAQSESPTNSDGVTGSPPPPPNNEPNDLRDFASLPTLLQLLQLPPRPLDTPYVSMAARPIEPVRERRFTFGLAASASLSQTSPDGKRLGGVGGAFAEYRLAPSWSLTAGAQWRFLPGDRRADSAVAETSTQLRYGFGYQQDEFSLETCGLHFLELPVGLQWRRGAFGAEAGVASGFLIGVQGRLTQSHSESLQDGVSETRSRVWLDKSPYRSAYFAPFFGAEWRATQKLGLSLRGVYHPGSLAKENPDTPPPGSLFWLDAGVRFRF